MEPGYFALVLHGHLPFVRHPEHPKFLEETWLFEAITEVYLPLIEVLEGWRRDGMKPRITLSLSPTLCAMLRDPLLQERYRRHLQGLIDLAEKETHRTRWEPAFRVLAELYLQSFFKARELYEARGADLVSAFRQLQEDGLLELITCPATHPLLPLLGHSPSVRGQILTARDSHRACFGRDPEGIWLPECAYAEDLEPALREAEIRWFIVDTHGLLQAAPRPRFGVFAPVYSRNGLAVFGRDLDSARQVWSRHEGYPGDPRYRDFYRDIGYDLDFDYVRPFLATPEHRGFSGIKYYRITGTQESKAPYDRALALAAADQHAAHFLGERLAQFATLGPIMDRPPIVVSPYDAELFGHWWYEGPQFLDWFVRKAYYDQTAFRLISPGDYLRRFPTLQVARPAASSWGDEGYWQVWLNDSNAWIYPHLRIAQDRMTELARRFGEATGLGQRALRQAARELVLAQASDWPFILRAGTNPDYARDRVTTHLQNFLSLYDQLTRDEVRPDPLRILEESNNLLPDINPRYWA